MEFSKAEQMLAAVQDHLRVLAQLLALGQLMHQLGVADHPVHRRAQLVRDRGDKRRLEPVGRLRTRPSIGLVSV